MLYKVANRVSDLISTSCGMAVSGSWKNTSASSRPSAIIAPSCASPPSGPLSSRVTDGTGLPVTRLLSGPLGGDAQLGAMIAEGRLDALIFFQDPLTAMPHDVDIKSLTRLATLYNILFAPNHKTADAVLAAL